MLPVRICSIFMTTVLLGRQPKERDEEILTKQGHVIEIDQDVLAPIFLF